MGAANLRRALEAHEVAQALVVLVAGGAALQVRSHPRDRRVGVPPGELELYAGRRCGAPHSSDVT